VLVPVPDWAAGGVVDCAKSAAASSGRAGSGGMVGKQAADEVWSYRMYLRHLAIRRHAIHSQFVNPCFAGMSLIRVEVHPVRQRSRT